MNSARRRLHLVATWAWVIVVLGATGCAETAPFLRTKWASQFPIGERNEIFALNPAFDQAGVSARCVEGSGNWYGASRSSKECLYVAVNIEKVNPAMSPTQRDQVVGLLLVVSDYNCSNWTSRSFANKTGLNAFKRLFGNVTASGSAISAFSVPPVAIGLSIANLLATNGVDSLNQDYFYQQTFEAITKAIAAERTKLRALIGAKQARDPETTNALPNDSLANEPYTILEALQDVRAYDGACSLERGVAILAETTGKTEQKADLGLQKVEAAEPAKKLETFNAFFYPTNPAATTAPSVATP